MKPSIIKVFAMFFVLAVSLSGCGGGSGGESAPAAGTQVTSKGAIEKFGSITVNGVEFRTKGATLFLPDDTATPQRVLQTETQILDDKLLKLGMVVTIKGVVDNNGTTGTAAEIEFRDTLKAKIDDNGVDLVNNTITVMGQKIALDDKIKPLLASLNPGDVVQVSGLPDDKGGLRATFIEKKDLTPGTELEIKGYVSNAGGSTFTLLMAPNATTGITVTLPAGTALPANGSFIEVKADAASPSGGAIMATRAPHVEDINVNPTPATPGVQVSIEGFPSSIDLVADTLVLNGQQVKFDQALFVGGVMAELATTKKIQAEGVITNNVLNAVKIAFKALPIKNPGISRGAIERSGSVVVNGVEFKTTGAVLHLRDDRSTPDRVLQTETELLDNKLLKAGMVVTVKGGFDDNGTTGTATEIEFRNSMEGRIDDKGVDFITVMGQKVIVDDKIKPVLSTLAVGDDVSISGVPDDKGGLRASFVEKKTTSLNEFEAKGIVSNLAGNSFNLLVAPNSSLAVTLGSGVTLPAGVANGSFVEVRTVTAGGVVTATKVELEDELEAVENEKAELEGFVASGTADDFFVDGIEIKSSAGTRFAGGIKADFAIGMKVEVEGALVKDAGGNFIINATKVSFKDNVRIDAIVSSVNAANTATTGDITLLGKKVIIGNSTELKGLSGSTLDLASVSAGQELEIRGFVASNGTDIIATRIGIRNLAPNSATFRPFLRGPVTASDAAAGTVTIAGITINTTSGTTFQNILDVQITGAEFFNAIVLNSTVVKVTWNAPFSATSAAVRQAELEN